MTKTHDTDPDGLDALLAQARTAPPDALPPALQARLLADAQAALPRAAPRPSLRGWIAGALAGIGGAPGLAGMSAAGLAGLWIGFAGPGPAADLAANAWNVALLAPDLSAFEAGHEDQALLDLIAGTTE
jgi:hypothetical protein